MKSLLQYSGKELIQYNNGIYHIDKTATFWSYNYCNISNIKAKKHITHTDQCPRVTSLNIMTLLQRKDIPSYVITCQNMEVHEINFSKLIFLLLEKFF